jgi:hypothetical protein
MIVPAREYRRHAAACRRLARVARDEPVRDFWSRLAGRWDMCAELADNMSASAQRLALKDRNVVELRRTA